MNDRPPLRDLEDLEGADAGTIQKQIKWELRRLISELKLSQLKVATSIGYESSAGAFSRWATGDAAPPAAKAAALDKLYEEFTLILPGETFASLRERYDRRKRAHRPPPTKYDAFVAAPMAAAADGTYGQERSAAMELATALQRWCGLTDIFYAGKTIEKADAFESPNVALGVNTEALSRSRYFIMMVLQPPQTPSGVYVEAGFALAKNIPSLYFVPHTGREYLPWMLETIDAVRSRDLPPVTIEQVKTVEQATERLRTHGRKLFQALDGQRD